MVRHKTRWLLVKVEGERDEDDDEGSSTMAQLSKKDVSKAIRENFESVMGLHGAVFSFELHVRFWDAAQTKLMLLRVPREAASSVRASLAFLTSIRTVRVALRTLSAHGSARTAKVATIKHVRSFYRARILRVAHHRPPSGPQAKGEANQLCAALENRLLILQAIDF